MARQYAHVLLFLLVGFGFAIFNLFILSPLVRSKSRDAIQKRAYECGMEAVGSPYVPTDIRFYLFALLFVVFDVETLFIYPWAIWFREGGVTGLVDMLVFMAVLAFGLVYAWRRGALRWAA
ncbi:MAG TPA: NADH-quinone oxidoreductase subunit A [Elusimicrobiota bacterium]|nr:NADH-quinone oxidoreductase subunit A [Elusimicrobiota bacterium]